jgi:hypothetical protein
VSLLEQATVDNAARAWRQSLKHTPDATLAKTVVALTIAVRGEHEPSRAASLNEVIHFLASDLATRLDGAPSYPLDVLVERTVEMSGQLRCEDVVRWAMQYAAAPPAEDSGVVQRTGS